MRLLWPEESVGVTRSDTPRTRAAVWGEPSGLPERLWRATGPPAEGSVERSRFGILKKARDVADAQAAILGAWPPTADASAAASLA
jgi:hypothetical protein